MTIYNIYNYILNSHNSILDIQNDVTVTSALFYHLLDQQNSHNYCDILTGNNFN